MAQRESPRRILLVNNHASLGDLHPFMGMARALQAAGHEVTVGTSRTLMARVRAAGLHAAEIGPSLDPSDPALMEGLVDALLDRRHGPARLHREFIFPAMERCLDETLPFARRSSLIVGGVMSYFLQTAAELAGIPWGRAILSPLLYWSAFDAPEVPAMPFLGAMRRAGPRAYATMLRGVFALAGLSAGPLHAMRRARGLAPGPNPFQAEGRNAPDLNLALFSRHFAPAQPDWPTPCAQPGFLRYDGPSVAGEGIDAALEGFLGAGAPPVLLTLGTGASVFRPGALYAWFARCIARMPGLRGVLLVGAHAADEMRARHASDRLFVAGYAPYGALMPRCAAVIHQGGIGTTARALAAGVPSVVVGHANDQLDNGRHLARAGAGFVLPLRTLDADGLADAIVRVASTPSLRREAARMGTLLRSEDADAALVRAVEHCLARRAPAPAPSSRVRP
ncbi:MAG: glycosyltransferase [Polyangiales bacterium]